MAGDRPLFSVDESHRLPFILLAGPTILHGFAVDGVALLAGRVAQRMLRQSAHSERDALSAAVRELWVAYTASFLTEAVLYPLETVIVRLHCQGMPVLVDDVRTGLDIAFIRTYCRGFVDCISGILDSEGPWGFYKGFSSLLLRYALHGLLLVLLWRMAQYSKRSKVNR